MLAPPLRSFHAPQGGRAPQFKNPWSVAKSPKMTDFFKITEQSRPGTSTERNEENYSVQEKEDYSMMISIKVIVNFQKM